MLQWMNIKKKLELINDNGYVLEQLLKVDESAMF